jgi:hypothetical protein
MLSRGARATPGATQSRRSRSTAPAMAVSYPLAEHAIWADTGFDSMRDQTFTNEPYVYDASGVSHH